MAAKQKSIKRSAPSFTYRSILNELERSIALMVLSNPRLEHEIIANFLDRKGYVVQRIDESDKKLRDLYGVPLPSQKQLALRAATKADAEQLYELAQEMRAENKSVVTEKIAREKKPKKVKDAREQNVDRMLKGILDKADEHHED